MPRRIPTLERFERKVQLCPGGCHLWAGATNRDGYGSFWSGEYIAGDSRRGPVMVLAHRWAYERFIGPIPASLYVLHHCDTPACVNPEHFFLGTQLDNVRDCAAKGRRNQLRPGRRRRMGGAAGSTHGNDKGAEPGHDRSVPPASRATPRGA